MTYPIDRIRQGVRALVTQTVADAEDGPNPHELAWPLAKNPETALNVILWLASHVATVAEKAAVATGVPATEIWREIAEANAAQDAERGEPWPTI